MKVLFIVDPQNDFVDSKGALYVKGAEEAIDRICRLIETGGYDRIMISQDAHQSFHIGHSEFWKGSPEPGTVIEIPGDLSRGTYIPALCDYEERRDVIKRVFEKNSNNIRIWPHHCLEGSWGYCFPDRLINALNDWSAKNLRSYEVYQKGKDAFCESFSLLDEFTPDFSGTTEFHICGFCKDICVFETLKAILENEVLPSCIDSIEVVDECTVSYGEDGEELDKRFSELLTKWEETCLHGLDYYEEEDMEMVEFDGEGDWGE